MESPKPLSSEPPKRGLRLLGNRLWIERLPRAHKVASNWIVVPDQYRDDDRSQWRVIAAGPGRRTRKGGFVPMEIRPGDIILWHPRDGEVQHEFDDGRLIIEATHVRACWGPE